MKKFLSLLSLLIFAFSQISFANEVDGIYRKEILNSGYLFSTPGAVKAINDENNKIVDMFIKAGLNPNEKYVAVPLTFYAIKSKNNDALEMLLKNGANPNDFSIDCNTIIWAIFYKNVDAVRILINNELDVNKKFKKKLPLNYAIKKKQTKIVSMLLKAGAEPDEKTIKLIKKSKDKNLKALFEQLQKN